jgi:hypothetical protein
MVEVFMLPLALDLLLLSLDVIAHRFRFTIERPELVISQTRVWVLIPPAAVLIIVAALDPDVAHSVTSVS